MDAAVFAALLGAGLLLIPILIRLYIISRKP